ncbi:MAG: Zn peptidase, partial [Schaedlerella sp.]
GEKPLTFNQVEDMSKKTNIPFGYFFLDKPPVEECSIVEYRAVDSAMIAEPSRNLMDTVDLMTDIQE